MRWHAAQRLQRRLLRRSPGPTLGHPEPPTDSRPPPAAQDVLRPFLLVCESRNPRLVGLALGSLQKLLAHDAASAEGRAAVLAALQQVERSGDEAVRLKILQTALTLLQSPAALDDEASRGCGTAPCPRSRGARGAARGPLARAAPRPLQLGNALRCRRRGGPATHRA